MSVPGPSALGQDRLAAVNSFDTRVAGSRALGPGQLRLASLHQDDESDRHDRADLGGDSAKGSGGPDGLHEPEQADRAAEGERNKRPGGYDHAGQGDAAVASRHQGEGDQRGRDRIDEEQGSDVGDTSVSTPPEVEVHESTDEEEDGCRQPDKKTLHEAPSKRTAEPSVAHLVYGADNVGGRRANGWRDDLGAVGDDTGDQVADRVGAENAERQLLPSALWTRHRRWGTVVSRAETFDPPSLMR